MKKLNILVVGDAHSVFIKGFVDQYVQRGVEVDVISTTNSEGLPGVCNFRSVEFKESRYGGIWQYLKFCYGFFKVLQELKSNYDSVVIHSINFLLAIPAIWLRKKTKNLVGVVWGSDFYRVSKNQSKAQHQIYKKCDKIVFTNPATKVKFKEAKHYPNATYHIARFGLPVLDILDEYLVSGFNRESFCLEFGFPIDKKIILVGYSGTLAHRQCDVIRILSELEPEYSSKLHLVFPVGYGSKESVEAIESTLSQSYRGSYSILTQFYDFEMVSKLRLVTDILINVQPSDQFSGSMQETLFVGAEVIAGSWLPYKEVIKEGARIININELSEIKEVIQNGFSSTQNDDASRLKVVREYFRTTSGWKSNLKVWDDILLLRSTSE